MIMLIDAYKSQNDAPIITHDYTKNAADTICEISNINNTLLNEVLFLERNSIHGFTMCITHDLISGITEKLKSYLLDIINLLDNSPCFDEFDTENNYIFLQTSLAIENVIHYLEFVESLVSSVLDITIESFYLTAFFANLQLIVGDIDNKIIKLTRYVTDHKKEGK